MRPPVGTLVPGFLSLLQPPLSFTSPNCPIAGPEFPPPQRLAEHPVWQAALANLTSVFNFIDESNVTGIDAFSYSIQVFSTNPGDPVLWERHRTARDLPPDTVGVSRVDGNTIYRLGSVSKVIAVLAFLAEIGDVYWNQPITKVIPEIARYAGRSRASNFDAVREAAWDDITIGSLAAQMSGIERDYGVLGEMTQTQDVPASLLAPFPPLSAAATPKCGTWPLCTRSEFFRGLIGLFPSYPPWQTATYSNIGYQLLAYALESISKKKFPEVMYDRIVKPLSLKNTYYENAPAALGIIPGSFNETYWYASLGDASPGGNMYSSPNDLSTIGRAILSSKLLKPAQTRRWLNPISFSSDIAASIGAPWGVRRIQLAKAIQPYRTLTVFTKAGTFRKYTAFLSLLKEFNLGFTIMMAGKPALNNFLGADLLGASLIPAYDTVARDEADKKYSGIYVGKDPSNSNPYATAWLTISTDPNKPGLGVGPWVSNGTDMVSKAFMIQAGTLNPPVRPETRLYYTQLDSKAANGGTKQSWKAVFEETGYPYLGQRMFSTDCASWVGVTGVTYGYLPLDEFVFNIDAGGKVLSVTNLALRTTYYKLQNL